MTFLFDFSGWLDLKGSEDERLLPFKKIRYVAAISFAEKEKTKT